MAKFKINSLTVDYYEEEIEAVNEDKAKEIFEEKLEEGELEPKEGYVFHDSDEEFDAIDSIVRIEDNSEEIDRDSNDEEDEDEFTDDEDDD